MRSKRFLIILLGILLIGSIFSVCVSAAASSESPESDFEFSGNTIMKYKGSGGAVVIPNQIGGNKVYNIGQYAFRDCTSVTSVTIPASVTNIGRNAFSTSGHTLIHYLGDETAWENITKDGV